MLEVFEFPEIRHRRRRKQRVHSVLSLETFLDDIHMECSQKPTPKSMTERSRVLVLPPDRAVIK